MCFNSKFWLKFSLINLLIVALLGLLMRYKIGFEFPYFDQKSLQHSHSHFAFSGWISHTLMVFMTAYLIKKSNSVIEFSRYNKRHARFFYHRGLWRFFNIFFCGVHSHFLCFCLSLLQSVETLTC